MANEKTEEVMSAIMGGSQGEPDYKKLWEDSQKELNSARVDGGRVKKLDGELKAARAELEALRAKKHEDDLIGALSDDDRNAVPDEVLNAQAKMVTRAFEKQDERLREYEERSFLERIDREFPGFSRDVSAGGDKSRQWNEYVRYYGESVKRAIRDRDFEVLSHIIGNFYVNELGISAPSGMGNGSAAPEPRTMHGGQSGVQAKTPGAKYSREDWEALADKAEQARDRGDYAECKRLYAEYENAPAEGRVV